MALDYTQCKTFYIQSNINPLTYVIHRYFGQMRQTTELSKTVVDKRFTFTIKNTWVNKNCLVTDCASAG